MFLVATAVKSARDEDKPFELNPNTFSAIRYIWFPGARPTEPLGQCIGPRPVGSIRRHEFNNCKTPARAGDGPWASCVHLAS